MVICVRLKILQKCRYQWPWWCNHAAIGPCHNCSSVASLYRCVVCHVIVFVVKWLKLYIDSSVIIHIKLYRNRPRFVKDMTKIFWCFFQLTVHMTIKGWKWQRKIALVNCSEKCGLTTTKWITRRYVRDTMALLRQLNLVTYPSLTSFVTAIVANSQLLTPRCLLHCYMYANTWQIYYRSRHRSGNP